MGILRHTKLPYLLTDEQCVRLWYRLTFRRKLNLDNPQTFNEKLQWLKLYNRKPEYTTMVDKYAVKEYIANLIGEEYVIPTLGIWDTPSKIEWNKLPERYVLKTTHGGGGKGVIVVKDGNQLQHDIQRQKSIIATLNREMKRDTYKMLGEWPYKDVPRRIIAEQYLEDSNGELVDYKFSCFGGKAYKVMLCLNRASGNTKFYSFDRNWNLLRHNRMGKAAPANFTLPKPAAMDEMFTIAETLSKGKPFVRVDLYYVQGHIYFGEMTFYPMSGLDANILPDIDRLYGSFVKL